MRSCMCACRPAIPTWVNAASPVRHEHCCCRPGFPGPSPLVRRHGALCVGSYFLFTVFTLFEADSLGRHAGPGRGVRARRRVPSVPRIVHAPHDATQAGRRGRTWAATGLARASRLFPLPGRDQAQECVMRMYSCLCTRSVGNMVLDPLTLPFARAEIVLSACATASRWPSVSAPNATLPHCVFLHRTFESLSLALRHQPSSNDLRGRIPVSNLPMMTITRSGLPHAHTRWYPRRPSSRLPARAFARSDFLRGLCDGRKKGAGRHEARVVKERTHTSSSTPSLHHAIAVVASPPRS